MEQKPLFMDITDLGLAAALVSKDYKIAGLTRSDTGRKYFMFAYSQELENSVEQYWAGELLVNARKFSDDMKMLKSRIYSED